MVSKGGSSKLAGQTDSLVHNINSGLKYFWSHKTNKDTKKLNEDLIVGWTSAVRLLCQVAQHIQWNFGFQKDM